MIEQVLKSKFLGALIGTGVGDSLGAIKVTNAVDRGTSAKREPLLV